MEFNPSCVRDIMLTANEVVIPNKVSLELQSFQQYERLKDYTEQELVFHIIQCGNSGLLNYHIDVIGDYYVDLITEKGSFFLSKIKNEKSWKSIISNGVSSLPTLISAVESTLGIIDGIKGLF